MPEEIKQQRISRKPLVHAAIIVGGLIFFAGTGAFLDSSREKHMSRLRAAVRTDSIPAPQLDSGAMGRILRQICSVRPATNDVVPPDQVGLPDLDLDENIFFKKRAQSDYLYKVNYDQSDEWHELPLSPDDGVGPFDFRPGWPLVSIVIDQQNLDGADWGIFTHWRDLGKTWEHEAQVTYYKDGLPVFSTRAGLRLHGGKSREPGNWHSYRIYFRDQYGLEQWPEGLYPDPGADPVRCMLLLNDWPEFSPFVSALAFDFTQKLGCRTPLLVPTMLYINGESQGIYYLCERVDPAEYASHVGHKDTLFYLRKQTQQEEARRLHGIFRKRFHDLDKPMTMKEASTYVDLDCHAARLLATVYGGATDGFQGPMIYDPHAPKPRWSWIPWDLDHSFVDVYNNGAETNTWGKKTWIFVYRPPEPRQAYQGYLNNADPLAFVFSRLMNDDPEYKRWFARKTMDAVNHKLSPDFTAARIAHYERMARAFGFRNISCFDVYRSFVQRRPIFLCEQLDSSCRVGTPLTCTVRAPAGLELTIDGYSKHAPYTGIYFQGHNITVSAAGNSLLYWKVNGERVDAKTLDLVVSAPVNIEAVCKRQE